MIDFACKQFSLDEVIKCSLSLTKADFSVIMHLIKNDKAWFSTDDIAEKLKLNLSTVQRAVKKLYEKQIIDRAQNNLEGGGYIFAYKVKDKKKIRELIMSIVINWSKKVEKELSKW